MILFIVSRLLGLAVGAVVCLGRIAHALVLLWIASAISADVVPGWIDRRSARTPHPLAGVYEVETFKRGGQEVPPTLTDITRWRELGIGEQGELNVWNIKEKTVLKAVSEGVRHEAVDEGGGRLTINPGGQPGDPPSQPIVLNYTRPATNQLTLEGEFAGKHISVALRRVLPEVFPLMKATFRWVRRW